jgi:hypothetical protein
MFRRIGQTRIIQPVETRSALKGVPPFKPGDHIQGTVVQRLPGGEVLLAAGKKRFQAHATAPLREGGRYVFKVLTQGPRIELKVLDGEQTTGMSPLFLWASARKGRKPLGALLKEIVTLNVRGRQAPALKMALDPLRKSLPALFYRGPERAISRWLSQALVSSGLFWESKVARFLMKGGQNPPDWLKKDLKGILLSLEKALIEGGSSKSQGFMLTRAREALQFIERVQLLNLASIHDGLGWYWFIPGLEEEDFQGGEVFSKGQTEGEGITITLLLQLNHLGLIKVDLSQFEKAIHVKIMAKEEETVDFIDRHLHELKKGFEKRGMSPGFLKCEVDKDLDSEDIPAVWVEGAASSLDLRI